MSQMSTGNRILLPHIPARVATGLTDPYVSGDAVFSDIAIGPQMRDGAGHLVPGAVAVVADSCLGLASVFIDTQGPSMSTAYLHVEFDRPVPPDAELLCGTGQLRGANGSLVLTDGVVADAAGTVIAHASMGAAIMSQHQTIRSADQNPAPAQNLDLSRQQPRDVEILLGLKPVRTDSHRAHVRFRASPSLANVHGGLHGGVGTLMCERTLDLMFSDPAQDPAVRRLIELRAAFSRPLATDGGTVNCHAVMTHRGRRTAHCRAELLDQAGKLAVAVDGIYVGALAEIRP